MAVSEATSSAQQQEGWVMLARLAKQKPHVLTEQLGSAVTFCSLQAWYAALQKTPPVPRRLQAPFLCLFSNLRARVAICCASSYSWHGKAVTT